MKKLFCFVLLLAGFSLYVPVQAQQTWQLTQGYLHVSNGPVAPTNMLLVDYPGSGFFNLCYAIVKFKPCSDGWVATFPDTICDDADGNIITKKNFSGAFWIGGRGGGFPLSRGMVVHTGSSKYHWWSSPDFYLGLPPKPGYAYFWTKYDFAAGVTGVVGSVFSGSLTYRQKESCTQANPSILSFRVSKPYPNPCHEVINIDIDCPAGGRVIVEIVSPVLGLLKTTSIGFLKAGSVKACVPIEDMPKGLLYIRVRFAGQVLTHPVVRR